MDNQQNLYDLASSFRNAMLVTRGLDGSLHARPMAVAELEPDSDAYFSTSLESPKIAEIEANPEVLVTFQSRAEFATIQGRATVVRDPAQIDRLWSEDWRVWFPKGKDDPNLCLLKISANRGEYWDTSGLEGLKFAFESVKARLAGQTPQKSEVQNAKVEL
jgi:general stress protein 26